MFCKTEVIMSKYFEINLLYRRHTSFAGQKTACFISKRCLNYISVHKEH